jgi:hypothetical protein
MIQRQNEMVRAHEIAQAHREATPRVVTECDRERLKRAEQKRERRACRTAP